MGTTTSVVPYFICFTLPAFTFLGYWLNLNWMTIWFGFGLIPILDGIVPIDTDNLTDEERKEMEKKYIFRIPLLLWGFLNIAMVLWGCYVAANNLLSGWQMLGFVLGIGFNSGSIGMTVAHELIHKLTKLEKYTGTTMLAFYCYMHFAIEHVYGHHKNVATFKDPATSRFGENFYTSFYPRTVVGSWLSAWEQEVERLNRFKKPVWSMHNQMVWFTVIPLAIGLLVFKVLGFSGMLFFFVQSWVAFTMLEVINYVEHYGLQRKQLEDGKVEKVTIHHSWNAPQKMLNWFLFKLQRHSDHHANALKNYQVLDSFPESPQLPAGYAAMAVLALCPPLWRSIMDPLVLRYKNEKLPSGYIPGVPMNLWIYIGCVFSFLSAITFGL
eukprot:GILI01027408.1.p1 GENE.GILI01027408.1~~GILI01027408.1.p1  ORF type:complete len:424 (+),score=103.25 GILI01027408.1:127-1272(+)